MSPTFTVVPAGDFAAARQNVLRWAGQYPGVLLAGPADGDRTLAFGGVPVDARAMEEGRGLACVRVLSCGVLHVHAEGYERSIDQLQIFLRWVFEELGPCKIFDDETGDELSLVVEQMPHLLFAPEPTFVDLDHGAHGGDDDDDHDHASHDTEGHA
jgi:hypothetical protein